MRIIVALFASAFLMGEVRAASLCEQVTRKENELVQWNAKGFEPVVIALKIRTTEHENLKVGLTGSAGFRFWIVDGATLRYDKTKLMEKIQLCSFESGGQQQKKLYITVSGRAQPQENDVRTFVTGAVLPKALVARRPVVGTTLDLPDGPADFKGVWGKISERGRAVTVISFIREDGPRSE